MTSEQPTCEQRIDAELQGRIAQFHAYDSRDDEEGCTFCDGSGIVETTPEDTDPCAACQGSGYVLRDNDEPELPDPLSIEKQITYHVALSTGGPADGFRLTFDPESGLLVQGEYYFHDWFDGATRPLSDAEADMIAEAYGIYVEPE